MVDQNMQGPGRQTYGRFKYDYDKRSINIIGVRHGIGWQIWAQKLVKNSPEPKILSLTRVWPA